MVQYHALGLLFHIRKTDRLAVTKLVAKLTKINMKSPFAVCMLVSELLLLIIVINLEIREISSFQLDKNGM